MSPTEPTDTFADGLIDDRDVMTLRRIAELYDSIDGVPSGLVERIQFGITLDALHAEIAELQRVQLDAVGARSDSAAEVQTVTFTSASLTTMVTITPSGAERVRIDGWVAPGGPLDVELRVVGDQLHTTADEDGRFVFDDVPRGLAQFILRPPAESTRPPVVTPSLQI